MHKNDSENVFVRLIFGFFFFFLFRVFIMLLFRDKVYIVLLSKRHLQHVTEEPTEELSPFS